MNSSIENRVNEEAKYIIETNKTVREIAKVFEVSKSTVHKDLKDRLKRVDYKLYCQVQEILIHHKEIRHIRGGQSTKLKYQKFKKKKNGKNIHKNIQKKL